MKSELNQRQNGTDGVQSPEGGALENGVDSNIVDMQSKFVSTVFCCNVSVLVPRFFFISFSWFFIGVSVHDVFVFLLQENMF